MNKSTFLLIFLTLLLVGIVSSSDYGYNIYDNGDTYYYGGLWNWSENATTWTFPIDSSSVYYNMTGLNSVNLKGFTWHHNTTGTGGDYLKAKQNGIYKVDLAFSSASNGQGLFGFAVVKNFNVANNRRCYSRKFIQNANQPGSIAITCFMNLLKGETVNIQLENELATTDLKIHAVNMNIFYIGKYNE